MTLTISEIQVQTPFLTTVIMSSSNPNVNVALIEGWDDVKFIWDFFSCLPIYSKKVDENKKGVVLEVIQKLNQEPQYFPRLKRIIGIIDSDFNRITEKLQEFPNLFYTDKHDIDAQIFASRAFERYFSKCCICPQDQEVNSYIKFIQDQCINTAFYYGLFRLILEDLDIRRIKKEISIDEFLSESAFNIEDFKAKLKMKLRDLQIDKIISIKQYHDLLSAYEEKMAKFENYLDRFQFTNGHDLARILGFFIVHNCHQLKKENLTKEMKKLLIRDEISFSAFVCDLENEFRLAYEYSIFIESELYLSIIAYESNIHRNFLKSP